ncbi:MAG: acyltransferase [Chloroflexi bacterium]|nr:acyltransferase [Chloroflexota bacterium]
MDNSISNQKLTFLQRVFSKLLSILGWTIVGQIPELQKYLVVGAPHTSNWDFIYFVMYINAVGLKVGFIGKDSAFWWPMGLILKKMGGIPVNRRSRNNFVEQIIDTYHQRSSLILLITPEGTRKKTEYWKSGFYYIAHGAHIPIIL